uniref:CCHC-type domain-containing protein n=1 Tax=Tanacetum cinerariifolium TaxID=118510 RepID=A0A6L2KEN5_TANCI|nr:hypothetical protein [Tanacetum cinerariifolium]
MILSGADNRPPMLEKDLYDSWKSQMELYMQNREQGRMILESVEHGPLIWPTVEENGVIRTKKYAELSAAEKIQADCDMKATSIIFKGLPADIYSLMNHHIVAKYLWERVQLLMQGTSLIKQERKCKLSSIVDSGFAVHVFSSGDDPIACLNKAMAFLTAIAFSRQGKNYSGTTYKGNATSSRGNTTSGQARVVKCYNCQGEGYMARQCTQPKRPRNAAWFKEKAMLAEAQEVGQILDEEQLVFLADLGIPADQAQTIIPHNVAFQTEDLDTYDSNCDDLSTAQAILMANISNYGSDVISEVPNSQTYLNDMDNQSVHALPDFEKLSVNDFTKYFKKNDLKAQLQDKDTAICKLKDTIKSLRKTNKEEIVDHDRCDLATINEELENYVAKLLSENERLCKEINHVKQVFKDQFDSIKQTRVLQKEHIEQAKAKQPLDNALDFACKHTQRIQKLLVYVRDTCPSAIKLSKTKIARTPMNKIKRVTFVEPIASFSTNQETHDSNKPMLHSRGVKCSTSASGSKPSGNTKNNRISQPSSSNKINKVEDQPRSVKTRKNKKNHVNKVKCNDHVMQFMSNANSVSVSIKNAPVKDSVNDVTSGFLCAICGLMIRKYFITYTKTDVSLFHDKLIQHMESLRELILERAKHKREKDRRVNDIMMQSKKRKDNLSNTLDAGLVVTKINETESERHVLSNKSESDTYTDDADINYVNNKQAMAEVNRNTTLESTDMSHRGGEIDQNADAKKSVALRAKVLTDSPVSTSIDQDGPSTSILSLQEQEHSPIIYQGFEESPKTPPFHDDPLNESPHEVSTSQGSSSNVRQIHTLFEHLGRWTKDQPIANVIRNPSRSVSIRKQLETVAMWCYFDAFLTFIEPKNFKQAMTAPS